MKSETQKTTDAETLPIFLQDFSNVWFVEALYLSLLGSRRDVPAVQDGCRGKGRVSWCTAACAWSSTAAGRGGAPSWASQSMQGKHQAGNKWEGRAGQHLTVPHPLQWKRAMRASGDTSRKEVLSASFWAHFLKVRSLSRGWRQWFTGSWDTLMQEIICWALPLFLPQALIYHRTSLIW